MIDCWFDSGAMPYAQYHYPFENKDVLKNISQQTLFLRRWTRPGLIYSLMAIATALGLPSPYENVIVMGLVMDKRWRQDV